MVIGISAFLGYVVYNFIGVNVRRRIVSIGDVFNDLTIVKEVESVNKKRAFLCQCICGKMTTVPLTHLVTGHTKSCGCAYGKKILYHTDKNGCHICDSHWLDKNGYPSIKRDKKKYVLSRFIYEQNYGKIGEGLYVLHKCDNPSCINPDHLFLGTAKDNYDDSRIKGRNTKGSKNGMSVIDEHIAKQIKEMINNKVSGKCIAKTFGISECIVSNIKTNKTWKHVE